MTPDQRHRLAVNAAFAIVGLVYGSWAARIPRIQTDRDLSEATLGVVLLVMAAGALVAMPFAGATVARVGSRRATAVLFLALPFAVMAMALSGDLYSAAAAFFLLGAVNGSLDVAMNAQAVLVEADYRRPIMSSFHAVFSGGMIAGSLVGAAGAKTGLAVPVQMGIVAAVGLATALLAVGHLRPDAPGAAAADPDGERQPFLRLPVPALWVLGGVAFCGMVGEGAMADWSTKYLKDVVLAPADRAALALTAFSVAMTAGRIFGDRLRAAWGDSQLLLRASATACVGLALALAFPTAGLSTLGFAVVGLALSTVVPVAFSQASKVPGLPQGVGISMVSTIGYAGFMVGPAAIGFVAEALGLRAGLAVVLALFGVMVALTWRIRRRHLAGRISVA